MRVEVGKAIRVGPGDLVIIRGQLVADAKLGRLYVFAKAGDMAFSPYVENISDMLAVSGPPRMYSPMSMRLDSHKPEREISFTADIDGWIQVMQEVDRPNDTKAAIWIRRTINPNLPWPQRLKRWLNWPWSRSPSTATSVR